MAFKFSSGRCPQLMTPEALVPRFVDIEGLISNRGANASKQRASLTRNAQSKPKDPPKLESSMKGVRSVQTSVESRVRPFNASDSVEETKGSRCPSHPSKRVKYFLANNTNIGFCTKCAVTMSEREHVIEEEKLIKIAEINHFRERLAEVRDGANHKLAQLEMGDAALEQQYEQERQALEQHFQEMFKTLSEKYELLVEQLKAKVEESRRESEASKQTLATVKAVLENYSNDIVKNYDGILNDLSYDCFEDIMKQYHHKLEEHRHKIDACQHFGLDADYQTVLLDLHSQVERMSLPHYPAKELQRKRPSLRTRLENKQNTHPNLASELLRKPRGVR